MLRTFDGIVNQVKQRKAVTLAVAVAEDEDILLSIKEAANMGLIRPLLVGDESKISELAGKVGLSGFDVIHDTDNPALTAVRQVSRGRAQAIMKGLINTSDFMRAILNQEDGLKAGRRLSHIMALDVPSEDRLIFVTDGAITPAPDYEAKKEILINALTVLHRLGYENPHVAALAANEQINAKIPATADAAALVAFCQSGQNALRCVIEGPIALDVATNPEAARHKKIESAVSGKVDLFLAPNIEAGNVLIKSILHWGKASMAGIVIGASAPVIMTSRSDTPRGKLISIALAVLATQ